MSSDWVQAFEQGESVLSLANRSNLPESSIVLGIANALWDWGESDKAIPILEDYLARDVDHVLQMAYLRCLMSIGIEDKLKIQDAVNNLHASFRWRAKSHPCLERRPYDLRRDRPLRLGFLCTYSNLAPVKFSLVPMLRALDHSNFYVCFFSLNQGGDPLLNEVCDEHVVLQNMDVQSICKQIQDRDIDILFDLNGILREDFPYEVFALQPSPIQAGWWNTPVSCGLETVKYYFMDRLTLTPDYDDMFKEKIIGIPGNATLCYQLSDEYPLSPPPCVREGIFTFGSFTALFKVNNVVLDTWAQILNGSSNSRIFIKCRGATSLRFQNRFIPILEKFEIDLKRIFLMEEETFDVMMARFSLVDLCLNTYSYGAGTTTLNALWQGIPTMTIAGKIPHARGTASMMTDCGLEDFVACDQEGYIQGAIRHSKNPERLSEIRQKLREHVKVHSTWLNPDRFARNFEDACRLAWHDWIESQ
jgi:protein O-GlcNAc transferase